MARTKRGTPPSYRRHSSGQACVTVRDHAGQRREILLGKWNSPESKTEYARVISELAAHEGRLSARVAEAKVFGDLTINEALNAFRLHAEQHYRHPDGTPTGELDNLRDALRPLRRLYGHTPARNFGPTSLRALREQMVQTGLCRSTVNARINRVRRFFRWAASQELVPVGVVEALKTVTGLQRGRSDAQESDGVGAVVVEHVEATLPVLPRPVAAMARIQLLTGCRPGEVMAMRGVDLDTSGPVWVYRPRRHKGEHRGLDRLVFIGPQAQEVIKPFLKADPQAYLFSPREYVEALRGRRVALRKTQRTPSELRRKREPRPKRTPGERYNRRSYRLAVVRACAKAGVPPWSPLQLRHTAATLIRARYGVEAAQVVLGHARADVTQLYAERDWEKARSLMSEIG